MLDGARILVAEDEALIGIDLADHFEGFGAQVVGPVATVSDAIPLVEKNQLHAALLDYGLEDGDTTPLIEMLVARSVPTVIYTGRRPLPDLRQDYPDVTVLEKPLAMHVLVAELAEACRRSQAKTSGASLVLQTAADAIARLTLRRSNTARSKVAGRAHG